MTTILALLGNRWVRGIGVGLAFLALIFTLNQCAKYAMSAMQKGATEAGVQKERVETAQEMINRMERASNAAETIRRDPDARTAECLRHARNPNDC